MTTSTQTSQPADFAPTKTGHCACCGTDTRSLFAMGHDARFRGVLSRALAESGWDEPVVAWFVSAAINARVSVRAALAGVSALLERDWTEKVERSASNSRTVRRAPSVGGSDDGLDRPPLRDFSEERIDALMARLDAHPLTGQWGWYRPEDDRHNRRSARVHATHRREDSSLIDLLVVEADGRRHHVEGVRPERWFHDEDAKA